MGYSVKGFIFLNGPWFKFGKSRKLACYSNTQFLFAEAPSLTGNQWLLVISHSGIKSDGLGPQASQQEEIDQLQKDLSIRRKMMEEMVMSHWVPKFRFGGLLVMMFFNCCTYIQWLVRYQCFPQSFSWGFLLQVGRRASLRALVGDQTVLNQPVVS